MHPKTLKEKLRLCYSQCKASAIVCCNGFGFPKRKGRRQTFVYLDHGSQLKEVKSVYQDTVPKNVRYISQSDFFNPYIADQYSVDESRIAVTGLPRNDQLYREYHTLEKIVPDYQSYDKIIIWAPTFRYHQSKDRIDCHSDMPLGIPVFYSEEELKRFNAYLSQQKVLVLLKPHPAQDIDRIADLNCSNIKIIYPENLIDNDIQTNELLAQTDALITDYSSIYYDYLLLDRPIAITLDDYEQYRRELGFVFDDPLEVLKGVYIYDIRGMYRFVEALTQNLDEAREERREIAAKIDQFHDANSTKRVFDMIFGGRRPFEHDEAGKSRR